MALTKVTKTGITDNAIDADKIEDGTIVAADIAPGTITNAKLAGSIANDKLANSSITVNGSSVSLGGSVSAGKVQWQSVVTADGSTATSATAGYGYFIDTTSAAHTLTLPGSPSAGDTIAIKDYAGTFGTNSLTIGRNGNNIQGVANDSLISTNRASIVLVYIDATKGWLYTNESNVADLENAGYTSATGGTITTSGDYKIHTFTGDGCFVVSSAGFGGPTGDLDKVDYMVVGGGGGGGGSNFPGGGAGGGGAGGWRASSGTVSGCYCAGPSPLVSCVPGLSITATTYPVTVGGGGSGAPTGLGSAGSGSNSVFSTITSAGGGFGGSPGSGLQKTGEPGGSGGGGTYNGQAAGSGNTPPVSPPQGNPGGTAAGDPYYTAGSGGGAGGAGTPALTAPTGLAGVGGPSVCSSISGSSVAYAGGAGGGSGANPASLTNGGPGGGAGAGYGGCYPNLPGQNAQTANRGSGGGGGGGSGCTGGGNGAKGIVIIRYKFQ